MAIFRIDVITDDGSVSESYARNGGLAETYLFAFDMCSDVAKPGQPEYRDVRWVKVYRNGNLLLSTRIFAATSVKRNFDPRLSSRWLP